MRALVTMLFGLTVAAHAGVVLTVNFNPNPLSGVPGSTLQFTGTLINDTTNTVFINEATISTFPIPTDDTPFLNNAPISLGPSETSSPFVFFLVNIPAVQAFGTYDGTFTVQGGADSSALSPVGVGDFEVDVVTPEPASLLLCGAAGLAMLVRRRKARV